LRRGAPRLAGGRGQALGKVGVHRARQLRQRDRELHVGQAAELRKRVGGERELPRAEFGQLRPHARH